MEELTPPKLTANAETLPAVKQSTGLPANLPPSLVERWTKNKSTLSTAGYKAAGQILAVFAHDLVKAKRMDPEDEAHNVKSLAKDLQEYPADVIERALNSHKKGSPWWPALAHMMKYIDPIMEPRLRERNRLQTEIKTYRKMEPEYVSPPREVRQRGVALAREAMAEIEMEGEIADQKLVLVGRRKWPKRPKVDYSDPEELRLSRIRLGIPLPGDIPSGDMEDPRDG